MEIVSTKKMSNKLPAIMALGYIAGHSDELAWSIIELKVKLKIDFIQTKEKKLLMSIFIP